MKLRVFLIALAGSLLLSACGGAVTTPETGAAAAETTPETSVAAAETTTQAPETSAVDTTEATVMTENPNTEEVTTEPSETTENRYHTQGWDYWSDYVYMQNKQPKYWIEFDGEFYLHCMFRSDSPEYYEVVYTLYPDWDAPCAQELTIRTVKDAKGNDISDWFEYLHFRFSYENIVFMEVKRNESTLAGGAEDNLLTGDYELLPPMVYPK